MVAIFIGLNVLKHHFVTRLISINNVHFGRPLSRPCWFAHTEATLMRHNLWCKIWNVLTPSQIIDCENMKLVPLLSRTALMYCNRTNYVWCLVEAIASHPCGTTPLPGWMKIGINDAFETGFQHMKQFVHNWYMPCCQCTETCCVSFLQNNTLVIPRHCQDQWCLKSTTPPKIKYGTTRPQWVLNGCGLLQLVDISYSTNMEGYLQRKTRSFEYDMDKSYHTYCIAEWSLLTIFPYFPPWV